MAVKEVEPTSGQIQRLWEQCGLKLLEASDREFHWFSVSSDGSYDIVSPCDSETNLPLIDLNNLLGYVAPFLEVEEMVFMFNGSSVSCDIEIDGKFYEGHVSVNSLKEAHEKAYLALFWAFCGALG